jgi:hypothetical protein
MRLDAKQFCGFYERIGRRLADLVIATTDDRVEATREIDAIR